MKATNGAIEALKPDRKTKDYRLDGYTGLEICVSHTGIKTFYYRYTTQAGKRVRLRVGPYHNAKSLVTAKERYSILAGQVAAGRNPAQDKRDKRQAAGVNKVKQDADKALVWSVFAKDTYAPHAEANQKTPGSTLYILRHNFSFLDDTHLNDIEPLEIERWKQQRKRDGTNPSTINRALRALKAVLNYAVALGKISVSPVRGVKQLKGVSKGVVRYLSKAERQRLAAALDARKGYFPVLVRLLLNTGMRPNEAFTLTRDQVDLAEGRITLLPAYTKTNTTRQVYLNTPTLAMLREWNITLSGTWLFPSRMGGHVKSINDNFSRLKLEAKLTNFRIYDLRHSFASALVAEGVSIYEVAELLGHANVKQTQVYAHLAPENLHKAVERIA